MKTMSMELTQEIDGYAARINEYIHEYHAKSYERRVLEIQLRVFSAIQKVLAVTSNIEHEIERIRIERSS